jgi:hypothetical protein
MDFSIDPNKSRLIPPLARLQDWDTKKTLNPAHHSFENREFTTEPGNNGQEVADGKNDDVPISYQFNMDSFEDGPYITGQALKINGYDFKVNVDEAGQLVASMNHNAEVNAKDGGYTLMLIPEGGKQSAMDIKLDPANKSSLKADLSSLPEGTYYPVMMPTIDRHYAEPAKPLVQEKPEILDFGRAKDLREARRTIAAEMLQPKTSNEDNQSKRKAA